ncbi:MAG: hypothetical protein DRG78_06715 [Epsilonproteobacteria bacterium]|nr:MAG: hypothetical protein DRG78_06715 [Campylobacterota bacterium]
MKIFNKKNIFIAPYTPISKSFKDYLVSNLNINFCGFIDKNKKGINLYKIEQIQDTSFDFIIIISPNHYKSIYDDYLKLIDNKKINIINIQDNQYQLLKDYKKNDTSHIKEYSTKIDINNIQRKGVTFISKGFIDTNNKYLYLFCLFNKITVHIVTDNKKQLEELRRSKLACTDLNTQESDILIAQSKYLIFDQANHTNFYISPNQITIQLWHGVGLKKMSKLTNITYDYFISTSKWTNESNFINIFQSKKFLIYGYPRNDFLLRETSSLDLLFCDKELYSFSKTHKIVLYVPTIREYLFQGEKTYKDLLPFNFYTLNKSLNDINIVMIIKLHPYVLEFFYLFIENSDFSNIIFHPEQGDIYPILKYTDILITDYSSIAYDFLLLDRPIIFFDYDREKYEKNMDGFLFNYDEYTPGFKVQTQEELITAMTKVDTFKKQRKHIKNKFFDLQDQFASNKLFDIIKI